MEKKPFSMQVDLDAFLPATAKDKEYMVQMRPPSTYFKDGVKRLLKNKIATVSFFVIIAITLCAIILPMFWPYGYKQMLGQTFGQPVDASYNNLSPLTYGYAEQVKRFGEVDAQYMYFPSGTDDATAYALASAYHGFYLRGEFDAAGFEEFLNGYDFFEGSGAIYAEKTKATHRVFKNPVDSTVENAVVKWLWESDAFHNPVRAAGDTALIKGTNGYYVVLFKGYTGGGEFVFPHLFGTDAQGRDYFIRVVYGTRISLIVGFFASIIVLLIGLTVGSIAGYCGGKVDLIIMRIVDIIYSLPDMLMVILLASVLNLVLSKAIEGTVLAEIGTNIISLFIVFALLYWVSMARLIRGQILSLREQEYVLAAKTCGAKGGWVIRRHLIPNCISVIVISTALQIPSAIFTESYLSFLGLGVNVPMPSLGSLASDALNGIQSYPYRLIIPAIVISLIVLALNLFGDGLRDAFDPKLNK